MHLLPEIGVSHGQDLNGQQTRIASAADGLSNTTQFTSYDTIGQLLSTQDPLSRTATTSYDWFGNPIDQTTAKGVARNEMVVWFHLTAPGEFGSTLLRTTGSGEFVAATGAN